MSLILFFLISIFLLPNLTKLSYGRVPLEQHHKIENRKPGQPLLDKLQTNFLFVLVSQRGCLLVLTFLPFMLHTSLSGFFLTWGFSKYATSIYHADWHTNNGERERERERGCCQCIYNGEREGAAASISPFYWSLETKSLYSRFLSRVHFTSCRSDGE